MHRRKVQLEDLDPRIILEEALPIAVVGPVKDEIQVLTATMDVLRQLTVRMSMDVPSVFVMITVL
jgi:hypothetical protein